MNEPRRETSEKLVEVHQAPDEWVGNLLIGYLRDNGVEATFQGDSNVLVGVTEYVKNGQETFGVYVLEHNAARARQLIGDFLSAVADPSLLEEAAAKKLRVDKETITRLRGAVAEERATFAFLGWTGVVFLGAAAVLWIIWPAWLKMETPPSGLRWVMVVLLLFGAVIAGRSTNK